MLLVLAINELLFPQKTRRDADTTVGVVPIGIPLIMGPAALTTLLISVDTFGFVRTLVSLLLNVGVVWAAFRYSDSIAWAMGRAGLRAVSKVVMLFLAAIAVMMIRRGLSEVFGL